MCTGSTSTTQIAIKMLPVQTQHEKIPIHFLKLETDAIFTLLQMGRIRAVESRWKNSYLNHKALDFSVHSCCAYTYSGLQGAGEGSETKLNKSWSGPTFRDGNPPVKNILPETTTFILLLTKPGEEPPNEATAGPPNDISAVGL